MSSWIVARLSRLLLPLVFSLGVVAGCADEIPNSPLLQGGAGPKKPDGGAGTGKTSPTAPTAPASTPAGPAGGSSSGAPALTAITPDAVTVGTAPQGVDVTITGKGFAAGTQVDLAGTMLAATILSTTQLAVHVPADHTLASGVFRITIVSKAGTVSNPLTFTVANPTSVAIAKLVPATATAGDATAIALSVTGSGFVPSSVVRFNGASLTTTFTSATELAAMIPANAFLEAGKYGVTVANGGDVMSLPIAFDVKAAAVADAGTGTTDTGGTSGASTGNPACVYQCADYGYAPGQCYQDWYCIPDGTYAGCLGQTTCN